MEKKYTTSRDVYATKEGFRMKQSNMTWNTKFELYKEYVTECFRFPVYKTEYKGVKIGAWLALQRDYYKKGTLSTERKEKLDEFNTMWKGTDKERRQENRRLLLASNWKDNIPDGHTPIDTFLSGEELCKWVERGIYDWETWVNYAEKEDVLQYYTLTIPPFIEPKYLDFLVLFAFDAPSIWDKEEMQTFIEDCHFTSLSDVQQRIKDFIGVLSEQEQQIIEQYCIESIRLKEIAEKLSITEAEVHNIKQRALKKLYKHKKRNVLNGRLVEEKTLEDLNLSTYCYNALKRSGITSLPELMQLVANGPEELMKLKNISTKSAKAIMEKVNASIFEK